MLLNMPEHMFDLVVTARWDALAARARELIVAEHGTSAATPWPEPVHRALHELQEAIAETEGPVVAEWAVSRWIHCGRFESVAESVAAERVDAPARLVERAAREARRAELQRDQQQLSASYGGRP
jgi:hypothetical protein